MPVLWPARTVPIAQQHKHANVGTIDVYVDASGWYVSLIACRPIKRLRPVASVKPHDLVLWRTHSRETHKLRGAMLMRQRSEHASTLRIA